MIDKLKHHVLRFWSVAPVATALLALALAATVLFGVRSALFWVDRHNRIAREQPVAAWMTPGYVAHSWHLPREVVIEALALDPKTKPPRETLSDIARERGVPVETLIEALEAAIAAQREAHPDPNAPDAPSEAPAARPDGDEPHEEPAPAREEPGE